MSCPSRDHLVLHQDEQLPVADAQRVEAHLCECPRCAAAHEELARIAAAIAAPAPLSSAAAFRVRVLERLEAPPPRRPRAWLFLFAGAAATAAILVALGPSLFRAAAPEDEGAFHARGGSAAPRASTEITAFRVTGGVARPLAEDDAFGPGDAIAFRYSLPAGPPRYLLAFAVDRRGDVHWFYPAYRDASTDPRAEPIVPGARDRLLGEVVQPEGVPPGTLRVVAVISKQSRTVKEVERMLAGRTAAEAAAPLFAGDHVREWRVRARGDR